MTPNELITDSCLKFLSQDRRYYAADGLSSICRHEYCA